MNRQRLRVDSPADLGRAEVVAVADGADLELTDGLLERLASSRATTTAALEKGGQVYGVSTGMGSQSALAVGTDDQPAFQDDLMLARAVGTTPWLDRRAVRAALATRLRTLLDPETGVSPELAQALVAVLAADVQPAVPATGNGAAGEIIALAHLGGFLTGAGEGLADTGTGTGTGTRPAGELLCEAGLQPFSFGPKEGVAFLQGLPVAVAQAALLADAARLLAGQALVVAAAEIALVRAPRDPYDAGLARGDDVLDAVLRVLRALVGDEARPRMLQAPVSFRVVGPAVTHLLRTAGHLEDAVDRALSGVSTSPALIDGRFLGTSGFDGFEVAAGADAVRLAVLHLAEVGTARLHRLLDPRVTGLAPQLSAQAGRQAGVVALHKRAVGNLHEARRTGGPAALGAIETSLGQEDVQSFALEATLAADGAAWVLRDVVACELVAVHQAWLLDDDVPRGSVRLRTVLHKAFEPLPDTTRDRPFGREVADLTHLLCVGWAHDVLDSIRDAPSQPLRRTT